MKKLATALAAACLAAGTYAAGAVNVAPLPYPKEIKTDAAAPVAFDETATVTVACPDEAAAKWLQSHFKDWYASHAPKVEFDGSAFGQFDGLENDEAYTLVANPAEGVRIAARTLAGVKWAAYTLRQMAGVKRGTMTIEGRVLPSLEIRDWPALAFRAVHLCWFPETRRAQIERAIRLAAYLKFNHVVLEPWGTFKSEVHPWRSWPDAPCTKAEAARIAALGRDLGVTIIPQMQIFGHASLARGCTAKHATLDFHPEYEPLFEPGGWTWCLSNPHAQRVMRELVAEMHEAFGNAPYFHLGCDEAHWMPCPACAEQDAAQLVAGHIAGIAAFLRERGARSMVWHDMFVEKGDERWKGNKANGTPEIAAALDLLPKDIVIGDWQYQDFKSAASGAQSDFPTMAHFREKGFDVCGCPWNNYSSFKPMADYLAKIGGMGFIETTWHTMYGKDWEKMFAFASRAAWGAGMEAKGSFRDALRTVGNDMKVKDYLDTGTLNWQVSPESVQK